MARERRSVVDVTDAEIDEKRREYWDYLDYGLKRYVLSLDRPNQRYFWSYLIVHEDEEKDKLLLEAKEKLVRRLVKPVKTYRELSAMPFRDAEERITSHSYFGTSRMLRYR